MAIECKHTYSPASREDRISVYTCIIHEHLQFDGRYHLQCVRLTSTEAARIEYYVCPFPEKHKNTKAISTFAADPNANGELECVFICVWESVYIFVSVLCDLVCVYVVCWSRDIHTTKM